MENTKKNAIRFAGFTEAWEQRRLSEIATMHARIGWQNLRTSEFLDSGDYMLITGTDFADGVINYSTCHYVEKVRYDQDTHIQVSNGSILITKDGTLGKVAYVQGLSMPATLNAGVFNVVIKDEKTVDKKYLFQYLKAPFLMSYVDVKATGGTIKHLNQNILVDFPIVLPNKEEQEQIGAYFSNLDNLITLHERKCERLQNVKKSMLEKMFPKKGSNVPEIRFAGFTEPWELRKLSEIADIVGGGTPSTSIERYWFPKEIPWLSSGEVHKKRITFTDNEISIEGMNNSNARIVPENSVLIALAGQGKTRGTVAINHIPLTTNQSIAAMIFSKEIVSEFVFYNLENRYDEIRKMSSGDGSRGGLNKQIVGDIEIPYTCKEEQGTISKYFENLDRLITLHQRELEKLKNIKKSMLEKMFV